MNADQVITNLCVVARVGINDKLLVTDGPIMNIQANTNTRSVLRWWYSETRERTVAALLTLFGAAMNLTELLFLKSDMAQATRAQTALAESVSGLRNLSETYRDDVETSARIGLLVTDIESFLRKVASHQGAPLSLPPSRTPSPLTSPRQVLHDEAACG